MKVIYNRIFFFGFLLFGVSLLGCQRKVAPPSEPVEQACILTDPFKMHYFHLGFVHAKEVLPIVQAAIGQHSQAWAIDSTEIIAVRGTDSDIQEVKSLLLAVDVDSSWRQNLPKK